MGGSIEEFNDKATKKKLRNRLSAQRARDRQKARMRLLEMEVIYLTRRNQAIKRENEWMKRFLDNAANGALPGAGISPTNVSLRCRQHQLGRARSNSAEASRTENHEGMTADGTRMQNSSYALQPIHPFFHRHYIPGSSMSLPRGFVQMISPWGRLTRLPAMLLDDVVTNSARKEEKTSEPDSKFDRDGQDCELRDDEYQSITNHLEEEMVASDDSSYVESSDDDGDETDEEESIDV